MKENADPEIQDVRKKCLKLSLTKKNHFAYIQKEEIHVDSHVMSGGICIFNRKLGST